MTFLTNILADIDWRVSELATLTTLPYRYKISDKHVESLLTYSVPAIYAIWEGYVRHCFIEYSTYLNSLSLSLIDVHENILTHAMTIEKAVALENPRTNFDSKKKYVTTILSKHQAKLNIPYEIPTKSNVNFAVINDILTRYNLEKLNQTYQSKLDKLLRFRNEFAHGERSIPVTKKDIEYFSNLVQDLMVEVFVRIEDGVNNHTYLKKH